ncbi:uncharacterized protein LOC132555048 [Ylistrum balloti]|uniref:uncharacterized protein LOC132555048 n=1 Tax=Ylistrum balloti TaxID=509963 RepID=UPI002905D0A5|nr:uncharacterized protein LOC132555048 [Ylistrum balloti]
MSRPLSALLSFVILSAAVRSENYFCSHKLEEIENDYLGNITTRMPWESHYSNNMKCEWRINAGVFLRIRITFTKIDLEQLTPGSPCEDGDFLSIQEGYYEFSPITLKVCPGQTNPYEVISRYGYLRLVFKSNQNNFLNHDGIEMKFEIFNRTECPPDWINGPVDIYLHAPTVTCFRFQTGTAGGMDFLSAQNFCAYSQSNLVRMRTKNMFDFVIDLVKKNGLVFYMWVGLTDKKREGTFEWLDGTKFNSMARMSSVNDKNKNCVLMSVHSQSYKVVSCDETHFYICQLYLEDKYIHLVQTEDTNYVGKGPVFEFRELIWIIIGGALAVGTIVICISVLIYRSKTEYINADYSSRQMEGHRSNLTQGQCSNRTGQDVEVLHARLVQPSTESQIESLGNHQPLSQPSAPPLSELQPVLGPQCSDQDAPPSYWEAVYAS